MAETKYLNAVNTDGRLNVSLIQRDVANDISMDKKYHAEDDMKKRAIHMSKNYDEFKNFVACSNQQPVQRKEMSQLFTSRGGNSSSMINQTFPNKVFNVSSELDKTTKKLLEGLQISSNDKQISPIVPSSLSTSQRLCTGSLTPSVSLTKVPRTLMDLEKEWRSFCTSIQTTLKYILLPKDTSIMNQNDINNNSIIKSHLVIPTNLRLNPELFCCKLCKREMSCEVFGDLIAALHYLLQEFIIEEDEKSLSVSVEKSHDNFWRCTLFVYDWMIHLPKSGGFDLNIAFLNHNQKKIISNIWELLTKRFSRIREGLTKESDDQIDSNHMTLRRASMVDEKSFIELKQLYNL